MGEGHIKGVVEAQVLSQGPCGLAEASGHLMPVIDERGGGQQQGLRIGRRQLAPENVPPQDVADLGVDEVRRVTRVSCQAPSK